MCFLENAYLICWTRFCTIVRNLTMNNETDERCPSVRYWYSIGESNIDESGLKPLQKGGFSHAAHECNKKCNKKREIQNVFSCFAVVKYTQQAEIF